MRDDLREKFAEKADELFDRFGPEYQMRISEALSEYTDAVLGIIEEELSRREEEAKGKDASRMEEPGVEISVRELVEVYEILLMERMRGEVMTLSTEELERLVEGLRKLSEEDEEKGGGRVDWRRVEWEQAKVLVCAVVNGYEQLLEERKRKNLEEEKGHEFI